jgi:hypothetical protein
MVWHTLLMESTNLIGLQSSERRETVRTSLLIHAALILTLPLLSLGFASPLYASSGTEGAAFLDIPVGAGPAAMGGAYTALANDAYAANYNPAGLGFLNSFQVAGQHLSYLDSLHYEHASFGVPLPRSANCTNPSECPGMGMGGSIQYLGTGDITRTDIDTNGAFVNPGGSFSSNYAAYNLSFGKSFNEKLAVGATGKLIHAKLDDVSASAYAADLGTMYRVQRNLTVGATLTNLGSKLKFLNEGDSLPMAFHLGTAYQPTSQVMLTGEVIAPQTGLASFHMGGEWQPVQMLSLRMGYRTDTLKGLSALAGYSMGIGVEALGTELAYAWLPYGDLGNTHYFSLMMKFGEAENAKRNLIQYQHIKKHRTVKDTNKDEEISPDYQQLMELLNSNEERAAQKWNGPTNNQ